MNNTKEKGKVDFVIYPEDGKYVGVCLTFNIVEEEKDFADVKRSIEDAALLHIKTVQNLNLSEDLLNRPAPDDYWAKYHELNKISLASTEKDSASNSLEGIVSQYFVGYGRNIEAFANAAA